MILLNKKKRAITWFEWLKTHNHLQELDQEDIQKTMDLFTITNNELCNYKYFIIKNTRYDKDAILNLLEEERFLVLE